MNNELKWTESKKELIYKLTRNYISVLQDNGVKIRTLKAIKFDRRVNRNGCCTMWRDNNMFVLVSLSIGSQMAWRPSRRQFFMSCVMQLLHMERDMALLGRRLRNL